MEKMSAAKSSEYDKKFFRLGKFFNVLLIEKQEFKLKAKKKLKQGGGKVVLETISLSKKSKLIFFLQKRDAVSMEGFLYDLCIEVSGYEVIVIASMRNLGMLLDELSDTERAALERGLDKINQQNLTAFLQKQLAVAA